MTRRKVRPLHLVLSLCIVAAVGVVGLNRASALAGPTVTPSPTSIIAGKTPLVAWTNIGSPTPTDWIGLYASDGAAATNFVAFQYTNGTAASGNERFVVPYGTATGTTYEFRLFTTNTFTELARTAATFQVLASTFSLTRSAATVVNGKSLRVIWSNVPAASPSDWVGLYPSSAAADSAFIAFQYTNSTVLNAGMPFNIPAGTAPGPTYEFRMFSDNGFFRIGAPSTSFSVT